MSGEAATTSPPADSSVPAPATLEATGLGIARSEIAALFGPFVARGVEPGRWDAEVARRRRKIRRRYLKRMLAGRLPFFRRGAKVVRQEYARAWDRSDYAVYDPRQAPAHVTPWEWQGERYLASDAGGTRVRQRLLIAVIERLRPRSVLEVGSGNGINLLLLSGRFPGIRFHGLELTREGTRAARELQARPELPEGLKAYAPEPLQDPEALRRVRFVRGSARELPFADGTFDLVFTVLALEQMESFRQRALAEVARVTARSAFMIEPFRDVNASGWSRRYVVARDYFAGRIGDLPKVGLAPVLATADFPQEVHLKACAVLSTKG